jgi:hypothetical protein
VELDLGTEGKAACTISIGGEKVPVALPKTKGAYHFEKVRVGPVNLKHPGEVTLRIDPVPGSWNQVNLRAVRLVPAGEVQG